MRELTAFAATLAKAGSSSYASHRSLVLGIGLAAGVLLVALGIPLALRRVAPNRWYGLRAALAYESESKWFRANRILGRYVIVAGVITIAGTLLIWIAKPAALSSSNKTLALVEFAIIVIPAAVAYVAAYSKLKDA